MIINIIKTILLGIVEGITEWLPISSTGHMILFQEFLKLNVSDKFWEMFEVVIQLGAIIAVVVLYFSSLFPLNFKLKKKERISIWNMWFKILVACIPAGVIGLLFDDKIDEMFYNPITVSITLIVYGILFILIENRNKNRKYKDDKISDISYKTAFLIGLFQVLSLIPGTSRSGTTILGGLLLGLNRTIAAEFTFFLAIPVMFGASLVKLYKFGLVFTQSELIILIVGTIISFITSIIVIKFLIKYIKKNDFKPFGWYRIILGTVVLLYFVFTRF